MIYVFGDSHALAPQHALGEMAPERNMPLRKKITVVNVDASVLVRQMTLPDGEDKTRINPILQKSMADYKLFERYSLNYNVRDSRILLMFGFGDIHIIAFSKFWSGLTFDPASSRDLNYIGAEIVVASFREQYRKLFDAIGILKKEGARAGLIAGPPPHASNDFIHRHHPHLTWLPSPGMRLAVFRAMQQVSRESAVALGFDYLDFSAELSGHDGFLKPEFEHDGVHGNVEYGKKLLGLLLQREGVSID